MKSQNITILLLLFCTAIHYSSCLCGGHTAVVGTVPYHVQIRFIGKYICSGAIVIAPDNHHVIITSGKCVTEDQNDRLRPVSYMNVYAGRTRINGSHIYEQIQPVVHSVRHPQWKRGTRYENDIAVLHVESGFKFNAIVQPVNLTNMINQNPTGELIISGWGEAHPNAKKLETYLRVAGLKIVSNPECNNAYAWTDWGKTLHRHFICAGVPGNPTYQGPCDGDNGSPATNLQDDTLFLVGVYSYRYPKCGNRYQPSVFFDLSYYHSWIREAMKRPIGTRNAGLSGPGFVWEMPDPEPLEPASAPGQESRVAPDEPEESLAGRSFGGDNMRSSESEE